jgi:predicted DNA-binding transcriptional regulator YafY
MESEKPSERNIEPVGLFHENNYWYVLGYCHHRKDYRQFRTDRMLGINRTVLPFALTHATLDDHSTKKSEVQKIKFRILVDKPIVRYMKSGAKYYGLVSEITKKDKIEMTFMTEDIENAFPRWYIMFGDYAQIVEPEQLKIRVKALLEKMVSGL